MTEYVIMPKADYQNACNSIRAKTGKTALIKSGDMASEIDGIAKKYMVTSSLTATTGLAFFMAASVNLGTITTSMIKEG